MERREKRCITCGSDRTLNKNLPQKGGDFVSNIMKRLAKWTAKTNPERVKAILEELRATMSANLQTVLPDLIAVETRAKQVLNQQGTPTIDNPSYLAFARELWRLKRQQFAGEALTRESAILMQKWVARGLSQPVLEAIRSQVFTISPPAP